MGNFSTDGHAISSYAMRLASKDGDGIVFHYKRRDDGGSFPSKTTNVHMRALERTVTTGWRYAEGIA